MLGISPNTLRSWERRYGFPSPARSAGGHRQYLLAEVESLRLALGETHNVSSAIALARERGEGPSSSTRVAAAFAAFDEEKANRLLDESLALRSLERTLEEVLLEALAVQAAEGKSIPSRIYTPSYVIDKQAEQEILQDTYPGETPILKEQIQKAVNGC